MISNTCVSAPPAFGWRRSRSFSTSTRQGRAIGLEAAGQVGEAQPPDEPERLEADAQRELRGAAPPVQEEERDLLHAHAHPLEAVVELDLEGVAVRADALEGDRLERRAPHAAEAAGSVGNAQPRHLACVPVAEVDYQDALYR